MKKKCSECIHEATIPGNCHSKCVHPELKDIWDHPLSELISISGKNFGIPFMLDITAGFNIRYNSYGFNNGWFQWPFNFDPVWLENCDKFEEKNESNGT
jgi:hypothetical protein